MSLNYLVKSFTELSAKEIYEILKLRAEIFVVEQKCPYVDPDGKDEKALHVMGFEGNELVSYARCFKAGDYFDKSSIGRVVVSANHRGKDHGKEIMKQSIRVCKERFGAKEILISAQLYLERFYTELGFIREGDVYPEDDIPHIRMRLTS